MNRRITAVAVTFAAAWSSSCSGGGDAPSADQLAGTWTATKVAYSSSTGLGAVDIVPLGGSATLVFGSNDTLQFTLRQPSGTTGSFAATYASSVDLFSVTITSGDGVPGVNFGWAFSLSGNVMRLSCGPGTGTGSSDNCAFVLGGGMRNGFDFNGDGTLEPATWIISLAK